VTVHKYCPETLDVTVTVCCAEDDAADVVTAQLLDKPCPKPAVRPGYPERPGAVSATTTYEAPRPCRTSSPLSLGPSRTRH